MSCTIKFIDTIIRNLELPSKRKTYWCDGCPGFGLRITSSGVKSFVFKYMARSRTGMRVSRWISIGRYPEWSIRKARHEYDLLYDQVHSYGHDPVEEKKALKVENSQKPTVKEFTKTYIELGEVKGKVFIEEENRYFKKDIWPLIGNRLLNEVTVNDIENIQNRIISRAKLNINATRDGKVATKHAIACVRRLFDLAIKRGLVDQNPVGRIEPLGITGKRNRVLNFEEIWKFWNHIENTGIPPVTAKALKFALITMQRSTEVRNMKYRSLKAEESVWQMERHETKSGTMHRVPLNRYALELIDNVRQYTGLSEYVFGATRIRSIPKKQKVELRPLSRSAFSQAIRKNRAFLGVDDFCPHDLRRTGATWITAVGLPKLYARLMLNHSDGERDVTGEVYIQYSYDFEKQRAAKVWEFVLDQIVTCESPADIPNLETLRERVKRSGLL